MPMARPFSLTERTLPPLAEARLLRGMTRSALADLSGVSARTIYRAEHGLVEPHRATRLALAAVLGREPADLFPEESERPAAVTPSAHSASAATIGRDAPNLTHPTPAVHAS
jgi:transcriptional regulator with XRE-family HTH domain